MAVSDLSNLTAAREWAGIVSTVNTSDQLIARLITAASATIYGLLGRAPTYSQTITERYDGQGSSRLMLKRWPVTSVSVLAIDNVGIVPAVTPGVGATPQVGYLLQPWDGTPPGYQQVIDAYQSVFWRGRQNVVVTYTAGYLVANEAQTIPATTTPIDVTAPYGPWCVDGGVTMSGVAMQLVTGTPITGQYALVSDVPGRYQFSAADEGKPVLISYSFVPADLFDVCTSLVVERLRYKARVGEISKNLGGEVVTFSQKDIPDTARLQLQPYRKVTIF